MFGSVDNAKKTNPFLFKRSVGGKEIVAPSEGS
jgi:hypothetical protein